MVRSVVVNADFESFLSLLTSGGSLFSSVFHVVQLRSEETEDIK
jgi:soluble P-type ATPase